MENKREFVSGVVEGFYGRPWSSNQRCKLFFRLKQMGLNTYLYAPKDDLKHRQMWRDLYTESEAKQLKLLIDSSHFNNVVFVYALSPGLDISFSNSNDIYLLKKKMSQVLKLGCNAFSLLFDDIHPNLNETDKTVFHSFAYAQSVITNEIYDFLNKPSFFLFCPTEYCSTRVIPSISKSEYLKTIGETLASEIDIMWTGPKVISKFITVESILKLSKVLKRPPIIWDNLHANDYDQRRLFLGPYYGRSSKLIPHIRGVLLNPNCEFEANFVAMHTLGNWTRSYQWSFHCATLDEMESEYEAPKALELALSDWLKLFYQKETKEESSAFNDFGGTSAMGCELSCQTAVHSQIEDQKLFSHRDSMKSIDSDSKETGRQYPHVDSSSTKEPNEKNFEYPLNTEKVLDEQASGPIKTNLPVEKKSGIGTSPSNTNDYKKEASYDYNPYFPVESSNSSSEVYPQMELTEKVEKVSLTSDMALDSIINANPLTPMETEENPTETDNVADSMAMQVDDPRYESAYEIMDIIDEMDNNSNSDAKKERKDSVPLKTVKSEMDCVPLNRSPEYTETVSSTDESRLTVDDLYLLVNMFFLPYHHGPLATNILRLINWLKSHVSLINRRNRTVSDHPVNRNQFSSTEDRFKSYEWHEKAKEFIIEVEKVRTMVDRFMAIPNRAILYDMYPYLQEIRYVISILISYVKWMGCVPGYNESLMNEDHEPWVFRGGLVSELQRMFPLEGSKDFFPNKVSFIDNSYHNLFYNSNNGSDIKLKTRDDFSCQYLNFDSESANIHPAVYMMRPFDVSHKNKLYDLCLEILCNQLGKDPNIEKSELIELKSEKFRNLPGDRYLGFYLEFCSDTCVVLEDSEENVCGYALGTNKIKELLKFRYEKYNFQMRKKYEQYRIIKPNNTLLSDEDDQHPINLAKSTKISTIDVLINGFSEIDQLLDLDIINGPNKSIIKLDLSSSCKMIALDSLNDFGVRLLKCLCSFIKARLSKPEHTDLGSGLREPCDGGSEYTDSVSKPHSENNSSTASSPLMVFCELDSLTGAGLQSLYQSCGFEMCNFDTHFVSLMSRQV